MSYKILVIENNLEMADNIPSILELEKYQVYHSLTGKEGIDLAKEIYPDLILCDIMMTDVELYAQQ